MPINHACFISYPHSIIGDSTQTFVDNFIEPLSRELGFLVQEKDSIYVDRKRLQPGAIWDPELTKAICESACMIVLYTPLYLCSEYCLREYVAMEILEEKRKKILGQEYNQQNGMIIPLVIPMYFDLPDKLKQIRQCVDVSEYKLRKFNTEDKNDRDLVSRIGAQIIYNLKKTRQIDESVFDIKCSDFDLPSVEDALHSWHMSSLMKYVTDPFPKWEQS